MANLFRRIVVINYQQVRFFPRWGHRRPSGVIMPEEYDPKTDSVITEKKFLKHETLLDENAEETTSYPKIKGKPHTRERFTETLSMHSENSFKHKKYVKDFSEKNSIQEQDEKPLTITQKIKKKSPKTQNVEIEEATLDEQGNFRYTKMGNNDIRISKIMADIRSKQVKETKDLMLLEGKILVREALEAGCKLDYILFSRMKEVEYLQPFLPKTGAKLYKMPYRELQNWSDLVTNPGIMGIFKIPDTESFRTKHALPLTIICDNVREPSNLGAILRTSSGVGCERVILTKGCVNVWETKVLRSACGAHFKLQIARKPVWDDIRSLIPKEANIFIADNKTVTSKNNTEISLGNLVANLPVLPYFSVNFKMSKHVVLIIGGETEGISEESYKLASEFNGVRLNVPLSNGLDSLNTGTALGIIAFEVKRQITLMKMENLEDYKVRNMSLNT